MKFKPGDGAQRLLGEAGGEGVDRQRLRWRGAADLLGVTDGGEKGLKNPPPRRWCSPQVTLSDVFGETGEVDENED